MLNKNCSIRQKQKINTKREKEMKIQQIQNNNTNFQGLHMDKTARKWLGKDILNIPGIKECADKFEVVVKSECKFPFGTRLLL